MRGVNSMEVLEATLYQLTTPKSQYSVYVGTVCLSLSLGIIIHIFFSPLRKPHILNSES